MYYFACLNRSLAGLLALMLLAGCGGEGQAPDPVVIDYPLAYIKRPAEAIEQEDVRRLITFSAGADLYLRERASPSAAKINLTHNITGGLGDVRDLQPSYDGERLLFSLRLPQIEGAEEADQPSWNIWEYSRADHSLRRIIPSDTLAEAGHDIAPTTCRTGGSCLVPAARRAPRRCYLTRASRNTRHSTRHARSPSSCCI
ncbi:hypothetical protein [endosymbiont of Ridgeia piscesae]|jgi:hypothetical protein|uniref:WD40-like Beta Propeller Repeat n=1 Tax=endosymbiont of Ridgeia piscesae TaxID=54398 RepID=A0A0T5YVI4_9GAMM|nr:hypothetical protein [endosymbiont of Ridgeia piscesae]KRT54545.1 hypothetical protein Ga0074115_10774 [endosymbiont of Ridgeia piscesae]KRT57687.1 hypothetical protein Ga0076813_12052 [endosymbiont of Ridgeia piscesae]